MAWWIREETRAIREQVDNYINKYAIKDYAQNKLLITNNSDTNLPEVSNKGLEINEWMIQRIKSSYESIWRVHNQLPNFFFIYDSVVFDIEEEIHKYASRDHAEDLEFWQDEIYRAEVLSDYEYVFWQGDGIYLECIIDAVLEMLRFTYINNDEIVNPAQQEL